MSDLSQPVGPVTRVAALDLVAHWREQAPTGVISRSRVVDQLLDLRSALPLRDRRLVDRVLADVPGITLVESQWWTDRLDSLISELEPSLPAA